MQFDISKSITGDKLTYIARDIGGIVRIRADSEKEMDEQIILYNKKEAEEKNPKPKKEPIQLKNFFKNKLKEQVQERKEEIASLPAEVPVVNEPEPKQFLQNDLRSQVAENKKETAKSTVKKGFWDKLK